MGICQKHLTDWKRNILQFITTVYASISDSDSMGSTEPKKDSAIFTTYDSSKGLERKIVVIFDYTESYWSVRINKPFQSYEILRNIFCVAASRGKNQIIC